MFKLLTPNAILVEIENNKLVMQINANLGKFTANISHNI